MEPQIYKTRLGSNKSIPVPERVRQKLEKGKEVEVVIREVHQKTGRSLDVAGIHRQIQEQMDREFPNLKKKFEQELLAVAGVTDEFETDLLKYSDREIIGMARMEKHLEQGEIIESLF